MACRAWLVPGSGSGAGRPPPPHSNYKARKNAGLGSRTRPGTKLPSPVPVSFVAFRVYSANPPHITEYSILSSNLPLAFARHRRRESHTYILQHGALSIRSVSQWRARQELRNGLRRPKQKEGKLRRSRRARVGDHQTKNMPRAHRRIGSHDLATFRVWIFRIVRRARTTGLANISSQWAILYTFDRSGAIARVPWHCARYGNTNPAQNFWFRSYLLRAW